MNEDHLAHYMGYALSHAINVENLIASDELMVPFVVYWQNKHPKPTPYPAPTQVEAVQRATAARTEIASETTGWSSCREGLITQSDGSKLDILLVEGWVPGLEPPLEMFVYCRKDPFRLIRGFMWKTHPSARKDSRAFMVEFKNGILGQPFGQQSLHFIENSEPVNLSAS